jgi:hypothetical protein
VGGKWATHKDVTKEIIGGFPLAADYIGCIVDPTLCTSAKQAIWFHGYNSMKGMIPDGVPTTTRPLGESGKHRD